MHNLSLIFIISALAWNNIQFHCFVFSQLFGVLVLMSVLKGFQCFLTGVPACLRIHIWIVPMEARNHWILELELQRMWDAVWVLVIELISFGRAPSVLNHWAVASVPLLVFIYSFILWLIHYFQSCSKIVSLSPPFFPVPPFSFPISHYSQPLTLVCLFLLLRLQVRPSGATDIWQHPCPHAKRHGKGDIKGPRMARTLNTLMI